MDLFKLVARVGLDSSGYEKGISSAMAKGVLLGNAMTELAKKAAGIGASLVKTGLSYNSQMEDYTTNFRVMLGSMAEAEAKVEELKTMAAKTPFAMSDLADATQTLLAFGVQTDKTTSVMTRLGDISLGNAQRFSSLSNAYGKAAAQGKLTGEVVQMMVDAGFNPLLLIAQETGETMTDLQKRMSAGAVSVDELDLALKRATSEGGQFYRGMEEASKTLSGQLSTLEDNWNAFMGEAMAPVNEALSSKILPKAIESLDKLSAALFGVEDQADDTKKSLFFDTEGNAIDPNANLLTWLNDLMVEWTNGVTEDKTTVDAYVKTFNDNTQAIRTALQARLYDLSNPVSLDEMQKIEGKIAQIDTMQARVDELLTKRAGGYITPEEEAELQSIIATLQTMQEELEAAAAFNDNIITPWEKLVEKMSDASVDTIDSMTDFIIKCMENPTAVKETATAIGGMFLGLKGAGIGATVAGPIGAIAGFILGFATPEVAVHLQEIKGFFSWLLDASVVEPALRVWENAQAIWGGIVDLWYAAGENIATVGDRIAAAIGLEEDFFNTTVPEWWAEKVTGPIASAWESVGGWIQSAIDKAREFLGISKEAETSKEQPRPYDSFVGPMPEEPKSHATGLDYVPYNEYPAILHEGEAVLTKMEATQWRSGGFAQPEKIDYTRLAETIVSAFAASGIGFSIGGRELATLTAGDNTRAINARQNDINIGRLRF